MKHQTKPVASLLCLTAMGAVFFFSNLPTVDATLIGLRPGGNSGETRILGIQTTPFSVATIGTAGVGNTSLSGLDIQPQTDTLFASSGFQALNPGSLFTINTNTGAATLVGPTGFTHVPGLAFDLNGTLFGSSAFNPLTSFGDALITINPGTGKGTLVGLYGAGIEGIDALAVHPTTGTLYGGGSTNLDELFTINKMTGVATRLGALSQAGTGSPLPNFLAGLTFDDSGNLLGSLGSRDGSIISIDIAKLEFTTLGDATPTDRSVSDIAFIPPTAPIPEPSTFSLFGLGLIGLAIAYRRKKNRTLKGISA